MNPEKVYFYVHNSQPQQPNPMKVKGKGSVVPVLK
jgi:hypothetical protein